APTPAHSLFTHAAPPRIYTLSLHTLFRSPPRPTAATIPAGIAMTSDTTVASRVSSSVAGRRLRISPATGSPVRRESPRSPCSTRSEEHTSELQSRENLVCRLLLEKKKIEH